VTREGWRLRQVAMVDGTGMAYASLPKGDLRMMLEDSPEEALENGFNVVLERERIGDIPVEK
jgi:hypothetical protein